MKGLREKVESLSKKWSCDYNNKVRLKINWVEVENKKRRKKKKWKMKKWSRCSYEERKIFSFNVNVVDKE